MGLFDDVKYRLTEEGQEVVLAYPRRGLNLTLSTLRFLYPRSKTRYQLDSYLKEKGHGHKEVRDYLLAGLVEDGYIDIEEE